MSYTEIHFGRFKVLAKGEKNIKEYINKHNIEVEYDDIYPTDYNKYCVTECYEGEKHLIEFIEHEELEEGDDFGKFHLNEDGTVSFGVSFYNGGCGLEEAIGDFYKRLK